MKHKRETRIRKLKQCLRALREGKNVQNKTWRTWIGEDGRQIFDEMWQEQLDIRKDLLTKPKVVSEYENNLKKAIFFNSRAEHAEAKGYASQSRFEDLANDHYAEALSQLMDAAETDGSLQTWFDRP